MAIEPISRTRVAIRIILVLLIVLLVGLWVFSMQHKAVEVRIATVQRDGLTASSSTNGIVEPVQEFEAHAPVATVVTRVLVKEGDHVDKSKLLLVLDDAAARAALAQASAAVKGAQASLAQLRLGGTRGDQLTLSGRTAQDKVECDAAQRDLQTIQSLAAKGDASMRKSFPRNSGWLRRKLPSSWTRRAPPVLTRSLILSTRRPRCRTHKLPTTLPLTP